jgi:hypothetical protein
MLPSSASTFASTRLFVLFGPVGMICAVTGIWLCGGAREHDINSTLKETRHATSTPFYQSPDSFYWLSYAREMIETGTARVRFTHMDNAPFGRPNTGWASLNAWYLVALANGWALATNASVNDALPAASLWSGPILYLAALSTLLVFGWRNGNWPAASIAVLVFGTAPRLYADFAYAVPGHHGWHDLACFAFLVCLARALRRTGNESTVWFVAAGLAAALAMWIGLTQQAFGIAAAGLGVVLALFVSHSLGENKEICADTQWPEPEQWRIFGWTAGLCATLFYLVEYFPGAMSMRLEVNHPVYAIGLVLGGEFLCRAQRLLLGRTTRRDVLVLTCAALLLVAIIEMVLFGPADWHTMRQPFIRRLHKEIGEFQPVRLTSPAEWLALIGSAIAFLAVACNDAVSRLTAARDRMAILVCALPCAVAVLLTFVQLRWAGLAGASAAALGAVLFSRPSRVSGATVELRPLRPPRPFIMDNAMLMALSICVTIGLSGLWIVSHNTDQHAPARSEVIDRIATIEVAARLRADRTDKPAVALFSDQKIRQAWIAYVTGIAGVGSLYWDSPDGIRDEAEFLGGYDDEAAHRIARVRGITHVITTPKAGSVVAYHYMWQGNKDAADMRKTLAFRLAAPQPDPPKWLQLVGAPGPAMAAEGVRIYRVL